MKRWLIVCCVWLAWAGVAAAGEPPRKLDWRDLQPAGEAERMAAIAPVQILPLFEHGAPDEPNLPPSMLQRGSFATVDALDGLSVEMKGYVVPFDFSVGAKVTEFLLVPYYGACIHTPPPPPNQIVYVQSARPVAIGRMLDPVRVTGIMSTQSEITSMGDTAYSLELASLETLR